MTTQRLSNGSAAKPSRILPSSAPQIFPPSDLSRDSSQNSRKRKRSDTDGEDGEQLRRPRDDLKDAPVSDEEDLTWSKKKKCEVRMTGIRPPSFAYPKTAYSDHVPSMPRYSETSVLRDILLKEEEQDDSDADTHGDAFIEAELRDFVIYRPHRPFRRNKSGSTEYPLANELVSLHEINENAVKHFYFDGVVCYAGRQRYVQRVPFELLSVGGYEEPERSTVGPYVWIKSFEGTISDVWYRLETPAVEYKRYHESFLWLADLAKHVVDYLHLHQGVALIHFRRRFHDWLQSIYSTDPCARRWLEQYGDQDFRRAVAANANFLYFQAVQVDQKYEKHPIWEEIHSKILRAIPEQVECSSNKDMFVTLTEREEFVSRRKTTVTPYVFKCFEKLPWAKYLYCQSSSTSLTNRGQNKSVTNHMRVSPANQVPEVRIPVGPRSTGIEARGEAMHVSIGDIVAIPKDNESAWKTDDAEYFGYVQSVSDTHEGPALGLLWFYRPGDTTCLKMFYPHSQELFLSDHCNCGDPPVLASEVIRKPQVSFFSGPQHPSTEYFCRQRYVEGDSAWITLQDSHFRCGCNHVAKTPEYCVGDTLLVASSLKNSGKHLEPVILTEQKPDGLDGKIRVVRLLRRKRDYSCNEADSNELVLTDRSEVIPVAYVHRACEVRFYSEAQKQEQRIPSPYDRQGASDFYYITSQDLQASGSGLEPLQAPWPSFMRQGWDPTSTPPQQKMRGLDLFCGGGNLGRGLEEGGAVDFGWAVENWNPAMHTYKANLPAQTQTKLFYGSVNHYLSQVLEGNGGNLIARFGEVEVICAGNPCQGYSLANPKKGNERGLFNESMVASVLAFIDFYRPKYAFMENVKGMALGDENHNVLGQVVCCLVGMGYQVRTSCLDAWSFGCPQKRSRIIITITAPGLTPLPEPVQTHSHPDGVWAQSLGKTANGLHTGSRTTSRTPFEYITAAEATKDLPATDARIICIPFPDHRMSRTLSTIGRIRVSSVPRFPGGCTFVKAFKQGYMPQVQIDSFKWEEKIRSRPDSRAWQRVSRNALMPTVMTEPRPDDGAGGTCLHWDDHRLLTIMEVRRGQGFPDYEVLIGSPLEQWKIVGNSVARPMALALGISLRTAWLANSAEQEPSAVRIHVVSKDSVNGIGDDHKTEFPTVAVSGDTARTGWSAKDMLSKFTATLTSPRALVSAISDTIGEPLTKEDRHFARTLRFQPSKHLDSVKT